MSKLNIEQLATAESVHTNEQGGKQSYTPARFDLIPAEAIAAIAVVLGHGAAKYGEWNWLAIDSNDHVNHVLQHIFAWLETGDVMHLEHASTRCLFALQTEIAPDTQQPKQTT